MRRVGASAVDAMLMSRNFVKAGYASYGLPLVRRKTQAAAQDGAELYPSSLTKLLIGGVRFVSIVALFGEGVGGYYG